MAKKHMKRCSALQLSEQWKSKPKYNLFPTYQGGYNKKKTDNITLPDIDYFTIAEHLKSINPGDSFKITLCDRNTNHIEILDNIISKFIKNTESVSLWKNKIVLPCNTKQTKNRNYTIKYKK